jgi:hypothetical protein
LRFSAKTEISASRLLNKQLLSILVLRPNKIWRNSQNIGEIDKLNMLHSHSCRLQKMQILIAGNAPPSLNH